MSAESARIPQSTRWSEAFLAQLLRPVVRQREQAPRVEIREAVESDFVHMALLANSEDRAHYAGRHASTVAQTTERFQTAVQARFMVAEVNGVFAGFYAYSFADSPVKNLIGELTNQTMDVYSWGFYVREEFREQGIGTALRLHGLKGLKAEGKKTMFGAVYEDNPTREYYESIGGTLVKDGLGQVLHVIFDDTSEDIYLSYGTYKPHGSVRAVFYTYNIEQSIALLEQKLQGRSSGLR